MAFKDLAPTLPLSVLLLPTFYALRMKYLTDTQRQLWPSCQLDPLGPQVLCCTLLSHSFCKYSELLKLSHIDFLTKIYNMSLLKLFRVLGLKKYKLHNVIPDTLTLPAITSGKAELTSDPRLNQPIFCFLKFVVPLPTMWLLHILSLCREL